MPRAPDSKEFPKTLRHACPQCGIALDLPQLVLIEKRRSCPQCGEPFPAAFAIEEIDAEASIDLTTLAIPGYQILGRIGRGGMGEVLEAVQTSLERKVALKLLVPELAGNEVFVARFEREAAALARLNHPNIVTIYERGRQGDYLYFVMEYVDGPDGHGPVDLRTWILQGRLTPAVTKRLMLEIADALEYAHQNGIVHRDVKPTNVMIDRHGRAKVADFGIASAAMSRQITLDASALGTPDYMAPEQRRDASLVDPRADIYSAGVMLYEMLTGELPLGAYQSPSVLIPRLDPAWDAVVQKAMQRRPDRRYPSMREFAVALEAIRVEEAKRPSPSLVASNALQSTLSTPGETCPGCAAPVDPHVDVCPACGVVMTEACPRCAAKSRRGATTCRTCGVNFAAWRQRETQLGIASRELEAARDPSTPIAERLRHLVAARKALESCPSEDDSLPRAAELDDACDQLAIWLYWEAGEEAFADKRFEEAATSYQAVLTQSPNHPHAAKRLEAIRQKRQQMLASIESLLRQGHTEAAAREVAAATRAFPTDAEAAPHLARFRMLSIDVLDAIQRIPKLEAEKRLWELQRVLTTLKQTGVRIRGLDERLARTSERIERVASAVRSARGKLHEMRYDEAAAEAQAVLARVADHVEALEIFDQARRCETELGKGAQELAAAIERGEWFRAKHRLRALQKHTWATPLIEARHVEIEAGVQRADDYARLVVLLLAGMATWLLAAVVAYLGQPFLPATPEVGETGGLGGVLGSVALRWQLALTPAVGLLASLAGVMRRRSYLSTAVVAWIVISAMGVLEGAVRAHADAGGAWGPMASTGTEAVHSILMAFAVGWVAATYANRLLKNPMEGIMVPLSAVAGGIGLIRILTNVIDAASEVVFAAGLLLAGLLLAFALERRLLPILGGMTGLAAAIALGERALSVSSATLPLRAVGLTLAAMLVAPPARTPARFMIVAGLSFAIAYASELASPATAPVLWQLAVWSCVLGAFVVRASTVLDTRLHLADRWTLREFRMPRASPLSHLHGK